MVLGAGLVGLCTAFALHRRRAGRIVVIDRTSVCGGASGASAGGLWPAHECLTLGRSEIARRAAECHERLRSEFPCDFVRSGLIALFADPDIDRALARRERARDAGFEAELLRGRDLANCEPLLAHDGVAVRFPDDGSLHPLKLAAGLVRHLRAGGVRVCLDEPVERLDSQGPGIVTRNGRIGASSIVVAVGAWTPLLTALLGWKPPIRPIRGTLLATDAHAPRTLRSVVVGRRFYYWQLACGPLAGGGSEEDVGFRDGVDDRVREAIRNEFCTLFPALRSQRFSCGWSGLRPFCRDMQPVIGRVPGQRSVYVSAGHFRRGILLAPLSGELVADELLEGRRWNRPEPSARNASGPCPIRLGSGAETLGHGVPVDHVVEGRDVIRSPVLVVEVVGVLPDIDA